MTVRGARDSLIDAQGVVGAALAIRQAGPFMTYRTITVEVTDHVALIRLNRPEALNAINQEMLRDLAQAISQADGNEKIRCLVLTGSEKAFAAGADVAEMNEKSFATVFSSDYFGPEAEAIGRCRKPIIAAVSGYCLGGGCELAMMCDFIIAADSAKFGQPETNLGIIAGLGGTQRLPRLIGRAKAMDMHLTGRFMDSSEAERAGLVSRVVPAKKLIDEATAAAQKIAEKSTLSVIAAKEAIRHGTETGLSTGLVLERRLFHSLFASADRAEGMAAFLEKREPQFRDR